jgi:hypothetical protein
MNCWVRFHYKNMTEKERIDKKYEILEKLSPHLVIINSYIDDARKKFGLDASFQVSTFEGFLNLNVIIETDTFAAKTLAKQLEQTPAVA